MGPPRVYGGHAILKGYVLRCLRNEDGFPDDFNVVGSSFQMLGEQRKHANQDLNRKLG